MCDGKMGFTERKKHYQNLIDSKPHDDKAKIPTVMSTSPVKSKEVKRLPNIGKAEIKSTSPTTERPSCVQIANKTVSKASTNKIAKDTNSSPLMARSDPKVYQTRKNISTEKLDNDSERINFVKTCSEQGGTIPANFAVFHSDSRPPDAIIKSGGFIPDIIGDKGASPIETARKQAANILLRAPNDFIPKWKHPMGVQDNLIKGRQFMSGTCCGISGEQKGGYAYKVACPVPLNALAIQKQNPKIGKNAICVYGDKETIEESEYIAMHLMQASSEASAEFVFLTQVPLNWITLEGKPLLSPTTGGSPT